MTDAEKSDSSSYKTAPNAVSTLDIPQCEIRQWRHPTRDTGSMAASDTASFRQREAELKSIEQRFGQIQPRRNVTSPVVSKFREEFNEPRPPITTKNSLFAKLHLPMSKRAKHPVKDTLNHGAHDFKCSSVENLHAAASHTSKQGAKEDVDKQPAISTNMG